MSVTIFDLVMAKKIASWPIWEDDDYFAFLTPFPNTPGATVVIPKVNPGGYVFRLTDEQITGLTLAATKVAKILEEALEVKRVAMVIEGTGVNHVHIKLYPLHGKLASETNVWSTHTEFYPEYIGYITTVEGSKMADDELNKIQAKIRNLVNS